MLIGLRVLTLALLVWAVAPQPAHLHGAARRIRMVVKNSFLRLGPNATVAGTQDDSSPLTILQRTSVAVGRVKIQGVHTCAYLCMDTCGIPYASKEYWDECIFNEVMESNHYNTYSSGKYSNSRRTLYLALNRAGEPRRVQVRGGSSLGKLSAYTRVLTQAVEGGGGVARCGGSGPPGARETGRCLRRGPALRRRRKRRRWCRGDQERRDCVPRPAGRHPRRHRKHRAPPDIEEPDSSLEEEDFVLLEP